MKCKNCKYWNRETISNWPAADAPANIGQCSKLDDNGVNYWDSNDVVNEKIKANEIGCENLYTGQDFGCIYFEGGDTDSGVLSPISDCYSFEDVKSVVQRFCEQHVPDSDIKDALE